MIRRDLLTTIAGIGAGQLILFMATPFLARAFGPEPFGHYSVIVSLAGVVAVVSALRLDLAVASVAQRDVGPIARAAIALPLIVAPAWALLLWLFAGFLSGIGLPIRTEDVPVVGLIGLLQGVLLAVSGLGTRFGAFGVIALARIAQPLAFSVLALTILPNLPLAMAAGWGIALLVALPLLKSLPRFTGLDDLVGTVRRSWRFVAISTPVALLDVLALALPLLFIASTYGITEAGNYSQIQRLIGAPLTLVATASAQVFFKHAGDLHRSGQAIWGLLWRVVAGMAVFTVAVLGAVILFGQPVLAFLMGPSWRTDTVFLTLTIAPVLFRVIASPVSLTLIVTGRLGTVGLWQTGYFLVTLLVLWTGRHSLSFDGLLLAYSCSEFLMYGAYLFLSARAAARRPVRPET